MACRIHDPLKAAAKSGLLTISNNGTSGYLHNLRETLQMIKFLQERTFPPPEAWDFLPSECLADFQNNAPTSYQEDLVIVEVSSIKEFMMNETYLQMNLLQQGLNQLQLKEYFFDFCAEMKSKSGQMVNFSDRLDRSIIESYHLLSSIQAKFLNEQLIVERLTELKKIVPNIIIVTYINIDGYEDHVTVGLYGRKEGIQCIKNACARLSIPVIDPGELVQLYGHDVVMQKNSSNHYNKEQMDLIGKWFYQKIAKYLGV